jgi:hypothetical protein
MVDAEVAEQGAPVRSVEELFGLPEGADEADVVDMGRALYQRFRTRREGVRAEFPAAEAEEAPGELVPVEPERPPPVNTPGLTENQRRTLELLQGKATRTYEEDLELERLQVAADPMRFVRRADASNGRR